MTLKEQMERIWVSNSGAFCGSNLLRWKTRETKYNHLLKRYPKSRDELVPYKGTRSSPLFRRWKDA